MKKAVLALILIIGSIAYVVVQRGLGYQTQAATNSIARDSSAPTLPVTTLWTPRNVHTTPPTKPVPQPIATPIVVAAGRYKNGTYNGSVVDAYYGNIQVAALITGGKLTNIKILQYPNDRGQSIEINQQALPILIREAISVQGANVDGVSGASETSPAFVRSLADALAKA